MGTIVLLVIVLGFVFAVFFIAKRRKESNPTSLSGGKTHSERKSEETL